MYRVIARIIFGIGAILPLVQVLRADAPVWLISIAAGSSGYFLSLLLVEILRPDLPPHEHAAFAIDQLKRWLWRPVVRSVQPKALKNLAVDQTLEIRNYRFVTLRLQGTRGELEVEISARKWQSFSVVVRHPGIPNSLRLEKRSRAGADLRTGDDDFDNAVSVGGDDAIALALLDRQTRRRVRDLIERGGQVADAQIRLVETLPGRDLLELSQSGCESLELLIELAQRLVVEGSELVDRMARNALEDPLEAVRINNLKGLSRNFPLHPECARVHHLALEAPAAAVRLVAAEFLMSTPEIDLALVGRAAEVLAGLAQGRQRHEELRIRALELLADKRFRALAEPILRQELEAGTGASLIAAIKGLAELEARASLPKLVELSQGAEADRAAVLAQALGKLGDIAAQSALLELLKHDDAEVVREAARALGQVGGVEAVEPLLERELADRSVTRVLQEAVRRIQGRLTGAEAGQLTLAASAELAGALSPANDRAGRGDVSLLH